MRKSKHLHSFCPERHANIVTVLQYNPVTDHSSIFTYCRNGAMISFKGKQHYIDVAVPKGFIRHHIAYHFDDPLKGTIIIKQGLHNQIHRTRRLEW